MGSMPTLGEYHARNVAEANAQMAAAGRCFMHNQDIDIPYIRIQRLANGNEMPLCGPCWDWWEINATEVGEQVVLDE
jgi:hypothetical protein